MRPPLSWKEGEDITWTRLTTPTEAVRVANLPHDYQKMVRGIKHDDHFLYECVNMAVPLRTASDLYRSFERVLREAGVPRKYVSRVNIGLCLHALGLAMSTSLSACLRHASAPSTVTQGTTTVITQYVVCV